MRAVPILIIVAILGGIGYVLIFQRDWIFKQAGEALISVQGFTPAKTPREAMDRFVEAVKGRNFKAAAVYCSGDYAELLRKGHAAASDLGGRIDKLLLYIDEKGFKTGKSTMILTSLDPLPPNIKVGDIKHKEGETKAVSILIPVFAGAKEFIDQGDLQRLDTKMFMNCMTPRVNIPLEIRQDDKTKSWLIDNPILPGQAELIDHMMANHRSYVNGLDTMHQQIRQGRYLKEQVHPELVTTLAQSK